MNEQVPIWAVKLYHRLTADLDGREVLVLKFISKLVHVQQEMPQLVDAYTSMNYKQNMSYYQMTKGVETLRYNVYAEYAEINFQSPIFGANVKCGMAVIAAE